MRFLVFICVFLLSSGLARSQSVLFRSIVSYTENTLNGEYQENIQIRVTDGQTRLLNSLTLDVYYNNDLTAWAGEDFVALNWFSDHSGYLRTVSLLDSYYRILVVSDWEDLGSANAWSVTDEWQTLVTLRWTRAQLVDHALHLSADTDAAAFFFSDPPPNPPDDIVSNWNVNNTSESEHQALTRVKIFLEGPYQRLSGVMNIILKQRSMLPLVSPYPQDVRSVSAIPDNVVDWVLVGLRRSSDGSDIANKSAFLRNDGHIINLDGTSTAIALPDDPGDYYVIVRHRNHLAVMTAAAQSLTFEPPASSFDFTADPTAYYSGTSGASELDQGVWGAPAGDASGDNTINAADSSLILQNRNTESYSDTDINLDGNTTIADYNRSKANKNKTSGAP